MYPALASAADDPLARARLLYNQRQYGEAVEAAEQARLTPAHADAADLVAARAYLERFRESAASDDLTNARDRLRRIDPQKFGPRERAEYVVGLGETLFFEGAFGAAATVFDSVLRSRDMLTVEARERVLDWWAGAVDREAKPRPDIERQGVYQRIRVRMDEELASHPGNGAAAYWSAAAARSQGDVQAAWDAAQAGWVRARLASDKGEALRADLDRLVLRAIVPDRAKATALSPETLRAEWERFKESWR
jgi:tetratricopeptide (TPR) repeat protein